MDFLKEFLEEVTDYIKSISKYLKFVLIILLFLLSSLFQLIPIILFNINTETMSGHTKAGLSLFSNLVFMLISIFLYRKELKKQFLNLKKMKKKKMIDLLDSSFRYWLIGLTIMIASNFIISKLGIGTSNNDDSVKAVLAASPFLAGLSTIIIAPFCEEMVFRLGFKDIIPKKWPFIITSGLVFGALHVVFSAANIYEYLYLIPYCSLGISFGFIYEKTDNIYISFLIHFIHNAITAVVTFLMAGVILW